MGYEIKCQETTLLCQICIFQMAYWTGITFSLLKKTLFL